MKIFVSWSGQRSQALAEAIRKWLPLVLHYAEPWLSKSDIQAGERWSNEVAKELQDSNFGILCVTKENLNSPWMLFEAGALAKSMDDGRVTPLLLDLDFKDVSGPLAQFQAKKADKEGIKQLICDINKSAPARVADDRLNQIFDPLFAALGEELSAVPSAATAQKQTRPQGEILELVASVRNVEMRVRDVMDGDTSPRRRSKRRLSPGMLMDMTHSISDGPDDPIQLLVFFSLFRDDLPWLYELAVGLYDDIKRGDQVSAQESYSRLQRALDLGRRGPFYEMLGGDSKMVHMMLSDAREFIPLLRAPTLELRSVESAGTQKRKPIKKPPTKTA